MKKEKTKNLLNILLIFICSFLAIYFLLKDDFLGTVKILGNSKWIFIFISILLQMFIPIFDGLVLMILTRRYKRDYTFKEGFINNLVGSLFCFITPSSTGGQFAQVAVYKKQNVDAYKSASCLIINFFSYTLAVIIYGIITLSFNYEYMKSNLASFNLFDLQISFMDLAFLGFIIYFFAGFGLILLSYSKIVNAIIKFFVFILYKLKIVKDYEKNIQTIDLKVKQFKENMKDLKDMKFRFILILLLKGVKLTIQFLIPYLCALALGVNIGIEQIIIIICLSCYHLLITAFIPIPGASGGSELFFVLLFTPIFSNSLAMLDSAMILWRAITFYIPLIYTSIVTLVFNKESQDRLLDYVPSNHMWFFYNMKSVSNKEKEEENDYFE